MVLHHFKLWTSICTRCRPVERAAGRTCPMYRSDCLQLSHLRRLTTTLLLLLNSLPAASKMCVTRKVELNNMLIFSPKALLILWADQEKKWNSFLLQLPRKHHKIFGYETRKVPNALFGPDYETIFGAFTGNSDIFCICENPSGANMVVHWGTQ